ncbi:hypothetical protein VTK73DRAFT_9982 [Phialemonium thermophilum]|uniref:Uncharacterized protein n=1 Tax=Phialemonium thermophilum TaxID=223376 RepID=A0ABR3VZE3_9PEZI
MLSIVEEDLPQLDRKQPLPEAHRGPVTNMLSSWQNTGGEKGHVPPEEGFDPEKESRASPTLKGHDSDTSEKAREDEGRPSPGAATEVLETLSRPIPIPGVAQESESSGERSGINEIHDFSEDEEDEADTQYLPGEVPAFRALLTVVNQTPGSDEPRRRIIHLVRDVHHAAQLPSTPSSSSDPQPSGVPESEALDISPRSQRSTRTGATTPEEGARAIAALALAGNPPTEPELGSSPPSFKSASSSSSLGSLSSGMNPHSLVGPTFRPRPDVFLIVPPGGAGYYHGLLFYPRSDVLLLDIEFLDHLETRAARRRRRQNATSPYPVIPGVTPSDIRRIQHVAVELTAIYDPVREDPTSASSLAAGAARAAALLALVFDAFPGTTHLYPTATAVDQMPASQVVTRPRGRVGSPYSELTHASLLRAGLIPSELPPPRSAVGDHAGEAVPSAADLATLSGQTLVDSSHYHEENDDGPMVLARHRLSPSPVESRVADAIATSIIAAHHRRRRERPWDEQPEIETVEWLLVYHAEELQPVMVPFLSRATAEIAPGRRVSAQQATLAREYVASFDGE